MTVKSRSKGRSGVANPAAVAKLIHHLETSVAGLRAENHDLSEKLKTDSQVRVDA